MNVTTLTISVDDAARRARVYEAIPEAKRTPQDALLLRAYQEAFKGNRLIDVAQAFRETGLDAQGRPKLAIVQAHLDTVYFLPARTFSGKPVFDARATRMQFGVPRGTFDPRQVVKHVIQSPVPHIPPNLRPRGLLSNFHILFEATWTDYPVDPFLLRRITGNLFVVEAEWELTPLEASLLAAIQQ